MQQFIYFLTNPGNESFLKAEMLKKYPKQLNFSFSRPGLVTYKNIASKMIPNELRPIYARAWGESLGILNPLEYQENLKNFADYQVIELPLNPEDFQSSFENLSNKTLIKIQTGPEHIFLGHFHQDQFHSPPGRLFYNTTHTDAPSRAYHKTKEAFLLLGLKQKELICAEFGCAPGGGSQFLLENGHTVYGVDPAEMDKNILMHKNFHFIQKPMQDIRTRDFPAKVDILLSDVNLNPDVVLKQCHGIFKTNPPSVALITLKTPKPKYLDSLKKWKDLLYQMGYKNIDIVQLSSHRKECLAIARMS